MMGCEIVLSKEPAIGPDIERFLNDAVIATEKHARRKKMSTYVVHIYEPRPTGPAVTGPGSIWRSVFAMFAPCCTGPTTAVRQDPKKRAMGWKSAPFILGCEIGERLGSTAITYNLIVYLTRKLNLPLVKAVYITSASFGASNLVPSLGKFLADAYLGRFTTLAAGSIFYLGGLVIYTLLLMVECLQPATSDPATQFQLSILFLSLTLQFTGSGAIRPNAALCGADQFDESNPDQQKQICYFFCWHKVCMGSAMIFAATVVIWIQNDNGRGSWGKGSLILSVTMGLFMAVFLFGIRFYRILDAPGSPLPGLVRVLVTAIRKRKLKLPDDPSYLYQVKSQDQDVILLHTPHMRWLDKAAVLECWKEETIDRCTVHQVEELKKVLRMAPIWLCTSIAAIVYVQTFTIMTEQAMTMDLRVGKHFQVPAATLGAFFSIFSFFLFAALYDAYLEKVPRNLAGRRKGFTSLQRIGVGIFMGILTMAVAAGVEYKRLGVLSKSQKQISGFCLVPQFVLAGLGESFVVPGLLQFFNDETTIRLQGMGQSFVWSALGMGGLLNTILVALLQGASKRGSTHEANHGWFNDNINSGRVEYFYFTLALLGSVNFLVYVLICISKSFTYFTNELDTAGAGGADTMADPV